jgi:hypothetical protein
VVVTGQMFIISLDVIDVIYAQSIQKTLQFKLTLKLTHQNECNK